MKKYLLLFFLFIFSFSYPNLKLDQDVNSLKISQAKNFSKIKGKGKKQIFIETLIPIINKTKLKISEEKKYIETLIEKEKLEKKEIDYLEEKYSEYNVKNKKVDELLNKMIIPPTSLILAQASLESGWGRSKVAVEGNNLFGMRSTLKDSKRAVKVGKKDFYKKYENIEESVYDYIITLSRNNHYTHLRAAINSGKSSIELIKYLNNYSEVRKIYEQRLTQIIRKNNLQNYD